MQVIDQVDKLRSRIIKQKRAGQSVGFVPTMGNLHAGHLQLVRQARQVCDVVVVSIYVNPMQFGQDEDFGSYPRTPDEDLAALKKESVDIVFMPDQAQLYPSGLALQVQVVVPVLSDLFCGVSRPGHFTGVATVVAKLFNLVQPDKAFFGEKDFQQLLILRRMSAGLDFPVEVIGVPTVREADGLAMSSRNRYLTGAERELAPRMYQVLQAIAQRIKAGEADFRALEKYATGTLIEAGFQPEYVAVVDEQTLAEPRADSSLVILVAARLGNARLIDNLRIV